MCLQISLTFSMCFFCCGLVQREVLLWNFKDYLKFQRNITEKFQKDRQFFFILDSLMPFVTQTPTKPDCVAEGNVANDSLKSFCRSSVDLKL